MTVRVYKSMDAGAPQITNTAGSMIAVLDACLVTGYGVLAPAGWTKEYSGTNKAAYKQGTGSNGFYLRVDDTITTQTRIVGYETMTDVDTGTNPFPTAAQISGGMYWFKAQDAIVRDWLIVATERAFYLYVMPTYATNSTPLFFFGDIQTYKPADAYHTLIIAGTTTTISTNATYIGDTSPSSSIATSSGHFMARGADQTTLSTVAAKAIFQPFVMGAVIGGTRQHENPVNGKIFLSSLLVIDNYVGGLAVRGCLPGLYSFGGAYLAYGPAPGDFTEVIGTDSVSGRTFMLVKSNTDAFLIETTDNW